MLGDKGINAIIRAHEERKDNAYVNNGDVVHKICGIRYVNKFLIKKHVKENKAENEPNNELQHKLRSGEEKFDKKKHCLFCGVTAKYEGRKRGYNVIPVKRREFRTSVMEAFKKRKDKWSVIVHARLLSVNNLHTADAVYQRNNVLLAEWLAFWTATQSTWLNSRSERMTGSDSSKIGGSDSGKFVCPCRQ